MQHLPISGIYVCIMWLRTSSVPLALHWSQVMEKKVSPFRAGMGEERQSKWMPAEQEEHDREGDDAEEDVELPRHRGHVCCGRPGDCSNISENQVFSSVLNVTSDNVE